MSTRREMIYEECQHHSQLSADLPVLLQLLQHVKYFLAYWELTCNQTLGTSGGIVSRGTLFCLHGKIYNTNLSKIYLSIPPPSSGNEKNLKDFHCPFSDGNYHGKAAAYVFEMADASDSSLTFFKKATPAQWAYVLSIYKDVLKLRAAKRTKKGGPEELIKLDNWYQEQLPKVIRSRKPPHITHEELVQITKWKLMRGKFRPRLVDLVKINTETAVTQVSKKAFRKIPNLSNAITALTNLKGVGSATASAILAAGFPEHVPYMADESMLSTPGIESTDYTLCEYLNYAEQIKICTDCLTQKDPEGKWTPHKVELTLWTHYLAREMQPSLLEDLPPSDVSPVRASTPNGKNEGHSPKTGNDSEESITKPKGEEDDDEKEEQEEEEEEGTKLSYSDESSQESLKTDGDTNSVDEPASKKLCV